MTWNERCTYSQRLMEGWEHKLAFVIQFRPETDVDLGRFEGKVEHIASYEATRFYSLDELLAFIARLLTEISNKEQP
jgi:hypothetical protein